MILLHIIFVRHEREREREREKNTPEKLKIHLPRARYKRDTNKMLKGLFTPQDESIDEMLCERNVYPSIRKAMMVQTPVVVESDTATARTKETTRRGKNFDRTFPRTEQKLIRDEGGERRTGRDNAVGKRWHILFPLFSPIIALIPTMSNAAFMAIELSLIILIGWSKIEYAHRATVWNVCLTRGIIVDFPKTHKVMMWLRQLPMFSRTFSCFYTRLRCT